MEFCPDVHVPLYKLNTKTLMEETCSITSVYPLSNIRRIQDLRLKTKFIETKTKGSLMCKPIEKNMGMPAKLIKVVYSVLRYYIPSHTTACVDFSIMQQRNIAFLGVLDD
jgi:hypothetical protein